MATHTSTLAWKIPWMEEPGGLQSMESQKVGHEWATSLIIKRHFGYTKLWYVTVFWCFFFNKIFMESMVSVHITAPEHIKRA